MSNSHVLRPAKPARKQNAGPDGSSRPKVEAIEGIAHAAAVPYIERPVEAGEAAAFLRNSARTVKQMAREGRIPAHPFGDGPRKRWFFLISELAEFLRAKVNSPHGDQADRDGTRRIQ